MRSRRKSYLRRNRFEGQFAGRLIAMLQSPAYRVLSLSGHRILARVEIELAKHGGDDNGKLPVTYEHFIEYGVHKDSVAPAIRECEMLGFIEVTERGQAGNREFRAASLYRLCYLPVGRARPTHEWQRHQTIKDAEIARRAGRMAQPRKTENHPRKTPSFAPGNQGRKPKFSPPENGGTAPPPENGGTSRLSGPISTARHERAASQRRSVVGCPSREATRDGQGTPSTEQGAGAIGSERGAMRGEVIDDGIPEFLRRGPKGAAS
jgi:hypothetical protein